MLLILGLLAIGFFMAKGGKAVTGTPQTNWARLPSGLMTYGQHYFFAIPWSGNYDSAHTKLILSTMFSNLAVWGPKESVDMSKVPQPMPADWKGMQLVGYVVGTGNYIATQNGSGGIGMQTLAPLGANSGQSAIVWESTEDYVAKTMSGNTK